MPANIQLAMKEKAYTLNDRKWRIIGIPLMGTVIAAMIAFDEFLKLSQHFFLSVLFPRCLRLHFGKATGTLSPGCAGFFQNMAKPAGG